MTWTHGKLFEVGGLRNVENEVVLTNYPIVETLGKKWWRIKPKENES